MILFFLLTTLFCNTQGGFVSIKEDYQPLAKYISKGDPALGPVTGNSVEIITDGARKWELLLKDIREAKESIYMEYYRWANDDAGRQIRDALMEKIHEGLDVRLLVEDLANPFYQKEFYWKMRDAGARLVFFADPENHQLWEIMPEINCHDHRKIVVIDGHIGYCGGMNLVRCDRDIWRDTHLRVKGPSVMALQRLFYDMWIARGGEDIPEVYSPVAAEPASQDNGCMFRDVAMQYATAGAGDTFLEEAVCRILGGARQYVFIQTPYFCPSDSLLAALRDAAARGMDVRILLPEVSDIGIMTVANQAYFEECLDAGVRIFEYTDGFNHSKVILSDDYLSVIGSLNMDNRSLHINHEVVALMYDSEVALKCRSDFDALFAAAREVTLSDTAAWSRSQRKARRFWRRHSSLL